MRKSALTRLVEAVVWFFLVAAALVELSLPFMIDVYLNWASDFYVAVPYYRAFILVFLMLSTACFLWILAELALIFRTIGKDPFVARNVGALKRMGWVALAMAALFFLKCIPFYTPMTVVCGLAMLICGLFSLVLGEVFARAVHYKQENDLTI